MRKRIAMVAASAVAAFGIGLAVASPASAVVLGSYQTEADCEAALAARGGVSSSGLPLTCGYFAGSSSDRGAGWELSDNSGG
ncbi:hypothetical protein [Streptomyces adelaidensis]|uniref:hypothetical protein n=1 Tax=Streptomyces adelaidensis TaxID=2796465 RepID=UPI001905A478|nr:hypothetical protein [Streptomyces adelaidensis]